MALLALGVALALMLLFGPLRVVNNLSLDLNTFMAACFMVVAGVQLVTVGGLSRYYAHITGILPATPGSNWLTRHLSTDRLALDAAIVFFWWRPLARLCGGTLGASRLRAARRSGDPAHRRAGPQPHRHRAAAVLFGVSSGRLQMLIERRSITASAPEAKRTERG